ncbi:MAG: protein TolR [Desulfurellaceae bacterium]|nr:protein TolR [Desulfurellaceae bacterium]
MAFDELGDGSMSQINVTPLVDVMLVLLVIFMVTTPILQQGVGVELPRVEADPMAGQEDQLVVAVSREGEVYLNAAELEIEALQTTLAAAVRNRPDQTVYLRADKNVMYGRVVEVMAAVRRAGVARLGMVTEALGADAVQTQPTQEMTEQ